MIIIDCREKINEIQKDILDKYETKQLDIGDYILSVDEKIFEIIERKSYSDLIASINDGRIIKQIKELKETFKDSIDSKIWIAITNDGTDYPIDHIKILRNITMGYKIDFIKFNSKLEFYKELVERNNYYERREERIEEENNKIINGGAENKINETNINEIENINENINSLKLLLLNSLKIKKNKINKDNILSVLLSFISGLSEKSAIQISSMYNNDLKKFIITINENGIQTLIDKFGKKIINKTIIENIKSIFIN